MLLGSVLVTTDVLAETRVPPGMDAGASRVLEIERVLGGASIQREGRTIAMQPGFLLFSGERMGLLPRARVDLRLLRYGDIDVMSVGEAPGYVRFEKLPFSSWAVDLATQIRLESGVLRVRWARSGDAEQWPLVVMVDRWKTQLANGEFLFRHDALGMVSCSVSGNAEMVDESANVRESLAPGRCLKFLRNGTTERTELAIAEWPELGVVLMRDDAIASSTRERSLAINSKSGGNEPVVPPPPPAPPPAAPPPAAPAAAPAPAPRHDALPIPPRVALSVAEDSVEAPAADAKSEVRNPEPTKPAESGAAPADTVATAPPADSVTTPPAQPKMFGPEISSAPTSAPPPPVSQRPLADVVPAPTVASPPGDVPGTTTPLQANAAAAAAEGSSGSGPEWIVNVMTVTDMDAAKQHIATLTSAGYPATLRKEFVRGRASYRVIIGGISNEQGARRTAQLLSSKMGYTAAWPLQKR